MNGTDGFLDIHDSHLRVLDGNIHAKSIILDQLDITSSNTTTSTVQFLNTNKAFKTTANIEVGNANLFVDTSTSNVGILTSTPTHTLDVRGTANVEVLRTTSNIEMNGGTFSLGGHIIPTTHEQYDIGTAEKKIRHLFLSDNSLWIGDKAKISYDNTGNKLTFHKRKASDTFIPAKIIELANASGQGLDTTIEIQNHILEKSYTPGNLGAMKLHHWLQYAKEFQSNIGLSDIFTSTESDYDSMSTAEGLENVPGASNGELYTTRKVRIGSSEEPTANLDIEGTLKVSGDVTVDTNTFHIDTTNNRVGIGVTSPQTNFHVESSGSTGIDIYGGDTSNPYIFIGEHMTNYSRKWGGKFTYYGDSNIRWLNVSVVDDNVEIPALTVRRNAHIGINEESPETTLHITNETATTGTGDAFISNLTGNTNNRKPTECLRLQGPGPHSGGAAGNGALLRFTNYHSSGNTPNSGEYNLAGIAGYDHDNAWGGGLAFYTSPGTGSGGDDLTLRMNIDSIGGVNIPGPTTGASHGSASMLYLLDTPLIKEWQWTGKLDTTLRVTFSGTELPTGCKAIYADVFMPQHGNNDHVGHALGKNHGQQTMWTGDRNAQPSISFGNLALQQCFLSMPGQSDGFEYYYGNWWNSCIIPLDTGNKLYHTVSGESDNTQAWIYMVVKGYFH